MSKQERQEQKIDEDHSLPFQEGFFVALDCVEKQQYNCSICLQEMRERAYNVNTQDGQRFIKGWKYAIQK